MRFTRFVRVLFFSCVVGILAAPAQAQWQPPIGIPAPSFGITQNAPPAPSPWLSQVPGYYYVEQKAGATNINNPYGTPAKPRISIPNPIPAGSVVELHGFYDVGQSSPNTIVAQGTAANPVFIRGASSTARPLIRNAWELNGTYVILENLEFGPTPTLSMTGSLVILGPTSHMALRNSEFHGTLDDGGLGIENWNGGVSGNDNIVIWKNSFHDNGDVNAGFDQDVEGIHVGSHAHHVWVIDNEMARNSGDGIQINAGEEFKQTTHHIYVGRNVSHHNKQGGFWVKQAVDVIFSQNTAYGHRPGNSSLGHCLGGQYAPDYVWWIYNHAYDCEYGIAVFSDWEDGQTTHQYFVGNVIHNIHNSQAGVDPNDDWSPAAITIAGGYERHFVNNTFNDVDSGINVASPFGSAEVKNNIITNLSQGDGNHVNIGFGSVGQNSVMDHNLFFPTPRIGYDGTKYLLGTAQMTQMKSLARDPLFRNPATGDFHIPPNSPAAASGEISPVYATFQQRYGVSLLFDADATPRPSATWMDMGAYSIGAGTIGAIDTLTPTATVGASFTVGGWALDRSATSGTGIDMVHVWAFPNGGGAAVFLGAAAYGLPRADIATTYGSQFANAGFTLQASGLQNGTYQITAYGRNPSNGSFNTFSVVQVTVSGPASNPGMGLGSPYSNGIYGRTFVVSGWAIDFGAPTGTGVDRVDVWAFPAGGGASTFLGTATYGIVRPDVGAIFGSSRYNPSGFSLTATLPPGNYKISAYMHSVLTNSFNQVANATSVTILASVMQGSIDSPTPGTRARPFGMWGWAADTGAVSGTGVDLVHVWAFPIGGGAPTFIGVPTYGQPRPDIGGVLGSSQFNNCGYSIMVTSSNLPAAGTYDLHVYARSTVTGNFADIRTVRVTIP